MSFYPFLLLPTEVQIFKCRLFRDNMRQAQSLLFYDPWTNVPVPPINRVWRWKLSRTPEAVSSISICKTSTILLIKVIILLSYIETYYMKLISIFLCRDPSEPPVWLQAGCESSPWKKCKQENLRSRWVWLTWCPPWQRVSCLLRCCCLSIDGKIGWWWTNAGCEPCLLLQVWPRNSVIF